MRSVIVTSSRNMSATDSAATFLATDPAMDMAWSIGSTPGPGGPSNQTSGRTSSEAPIG